MFKTLFIVLILAGLGLSGCGSAAPEAGEAQPLPADVSPATAPAATAPLSQAGQGQLPADSDPAVQFGANGGIAGFCDSLAVAADGAYTFARPCRDQALSGTLSGADLNSLQSWVKSLADFTLTLEDNPGGPDNLTTTLIFNGQGQVEADEMQRRVILDWVTGLAVRLDAQQANLPAPAEPVAVQPLCPDVPRPAVVTADFENPNLLVITDPTSLARCELTLSRLPAGRIAAAAGSLFYPTYDPETETVVVLQITPAGEQIPLDFTEISAEVQGPADFAVSEDGSAIAWSRTTVDFEVDPPLYTNSLWIAKIDGSQPVAIFDQVQNENGRFVTPVRFSADGSRLYYALQVDIPELVLSGRFDSLYAVPVGGGEAEELFSCEAAAIVPFCIGGLADDGQTLAILKPESGVFEVMDAAGTVISSVPLPATDYVDRAVFAPNGSLAFVTAALTQADEEAAPVPDPGYLTVLPAPYQGQAQTLLSDGSVGAVWDWLDETHLAYGVLADEGRMNTAVVSLDGTTSETLPNVAVTILK